MFLRLFFCLRPRLVLRRPPDRGLSEGVELAVVGLVVFVVALGLAALAALGFVFVVALGLAALVALELAALVVALGLVVFVVALDLAVAF